MRVLGNIVYGVSLTAFFVGVVLLSILVTGAIQEAARSLDFRAYAGFALALISVGFASAWTLAHTQRVKEHKHQPDPRISYSILDVAPDGIHTVQCFCGARRTYGPRREDDTGWVLTNDGSTSAPAPVR